MPAVDMAVMCILNSDARSTEPEENRSPDLYIFKQLQYIRVYVQVLTGNWYKYMYHGGFTSQELTNERISCSALVVDSII